MLKDPNRAVLPVMLLLGWFYHYLNDLTDCRAIQETCDTWDILLERWPEITLFFQELSLLRWCGQIPLALSSNPCSPAHQHRHVHLRCVQHLQDRVSQFLLFFSCPKTALWPIGYNVGQKGTITYMPGLTNNCKAILKTGTKTFRELPQRAILETFDLEPFDWSVQEAWPDQQKCNEK